VWVITTQHGGHVTSKNFFSILIDLYHHLSHSPFYIATTVLILLKHIHTFNGPLSGTTQVSWYQKGKTNLDFTEARDSEWQWHQLGHMQVCTSLQTDNHVSTPPLSFFTGRVPFLPPNCVKSPSYSK